VTQRNRQLNQSVTNPPLKDDGRPSKPLELLEDLDDDTPVSVDTYLSIMRSFETKGLPTKDRLRLLLKLKRMRQQLN
jgi:hypothetical protein